MIMYAGMRNYPYTSFSLFFCLSLVHCYICIYINTSFALSLPSLFPPSLFLPPLERTGSESRRSHGTQGQCTSLTANEHKENSCAL